MVRFLAVSAILLFSTLTVLAGEDAIDFARDKAGNEVAIFADKKALNYLKLEKFVLEDAEKPVQLTIHCVITKSKGEDDDFRFVAYDKDGVVLATRKMGTREETKLMLDERTRVKLQVPAKTAKIRFKTDL